MAVTLCNIQNKSSLPFLSLGYVLSMFLNFGRFSASCSNKKESNTTFNIKTRLTKLFQEQTFEGMLNVMLVVILA